MTVDVRNAATVIAIRDPDTAPRVLMGQRGSKAAFMPDKFVFPGGAVDPGDGDLPFASELEPLCRDRLADQTTTVTPEALAGAAIRELWEETGLILGARGDWRDPPPDWAGFARAGLRPDPAPLSFVFRAITPPGRPRRFDARFFLIDARHLTGDLDDFSGAADELRHVQWVPLDAARGYNLPFITEIVLEQIALRLPRTDAPDIVPFFRNSDEDSLLKVLGRA